MNEQDAIPCVESNDEHHWECDSLAEVMEYAKAADLLGITYTIEKYLAYQFSEHSLEMECWRYSITIKSWRVSK